MSLVADYRKRSSLPTVTRKRPALTQADYVEAAVEFVSEHGIAAMTMRALGDQMGVDATALYRHFPNKDSLIAAMVDWVLGKAVEEAQAATGSPRERVRAINMAMRNAFRRWPQIALELFQGEAGMAENSGVMSNLGIEALRDLGLKGESLVRGYQMIEGYAMGTCVHDFAGAPHNMGIRRLRYRSFDVPEFDDVARSDTLATDIAEESFLRGLDALIDECERIAAQGRW